MGTLFGGVAMSLSDEAGFLCASIAYPNACFVTKVFEAFDFLAPAKLGDILQINTTVISKGNTSVKISIKGVNAKTQSPIFSTSAVFVNAPNGVKTPI